MSAWRAYFDDGFVGIDMIPMNYHRGMISVAEQEPDHNWIFWYGKDWYLLQKDGHWMGTDQSGMEDQITSRLDCIQAIFQGRTMVPFSSYQSIIDRMLRECQPQKTGWHPGEKV